MNKALFSRIVVAIDGSEPSTCAVDFASRLARDHSSELLLCFSVNGIPIVADAGTSGAYVDAAAIIEGLQEEGTSYLDAATTAARRYGVTAQRRMLDGDPASAVLKLARDTDCSVIVMGTHGRRGLGRLFMGSTTEAVLRDSVIPVLTLQAAPTAADERQRCLGRLLLAIDDSEPSDAALTVAYDLPAEDRREVLVYSVVDIDIPFGPRTTVAIETQLAAEAHRLVDNAVTTARDKGVNARGFVMEGRPDDVIVNAAKEQRADLIIVGSHGRRGLRRFFLGSVAEHVVRAASVPTLVVRTAVEVPAPGRPAPELSASHV